MTGKITPKMKEELARWVGFKQRPDNGCWKWPNGAVGFRIPDLTSLDNLFKWVVVPLLWVCEMTMDEGIFFIWTVGHPKYGEPVRGPAEEDAGHALFLAIYKLKEAEGGKG